MAYESVPMRTLRLAALFMSFAFGVIGGSVGLNALIKSNQEHTTVNRAAAALSATITIDDKDVFDSGIVLTTVCALIALLSLIYFLLTLLSRPSSSSHPTSTPPPLGTRTLPLQSLSLAFCALWLFATQIAFTDFVANREAGISATIGGQQVPESFLQAAEAQLGVTGVYRRIHYLRLLAILPWFAILFTSIAAVILFLASRRRAIPSRGLASNSAASGVGQREDREGVEEVREREKGGEDEKGRV
ncbi:uncharacterized protein STEHIDRAFT_100777 [Stereum hirsutum FP-91666 SS1]|uniref:uncharacterized protein n=1 Tax=Stereum hirsutum (strain FP-91666) TaxID=721885 RepID=UPI000444A75D|nr:uncharacterized protein STEHIDRAFT_100777 [Stereum hirsutum FP-91666 SS1]EIM83785.1 hypothetical protein STEHIDRAFT_100777 [Stereum hirsutum FP-91666 SS1]